MGSVLTKWVPARWLEWGDVDCECVQRARREKVALCFLMVLLSTGVVSLILFISLVSCPCDALYGYLEVGEHHDVKNDFWVSVWGSVYDLTALRRTHPGTGLMDGFAGQDASECFPLDPSICGFTTEPRQSNVSNSSRCMPHDASIMARVFDINNNGLRKGYLVYRKPGIMASLLHGGS